MNTCHVDVHRSPLRAESESGARTRSEVRVRLVRTTERRGLEENQIFSTGFFSCQVARHYKINSLDLLVEIGGEKIQVKMRSLQCNNICRLRNNVIVLPFVSCITVNIDSAQEALFPIQLHTEIYNIVFFLLIKVSIIYITLSTFTTKQDLSRQEKS